MRGKLVIDDAAKYGKRNESYRIWRSGAFLDRLAQFRKFMMKVLAMPVSAQRHWLAIRDVAAGAGDASGDDATMQARL